jgi:hypothetical protein
MTISNTRQWIQQTVEQILLQNLSLSLYFVNLGP